MSKYCTTKLRIILSILIISTALITSCGDESVNPVKMMDDVTTGTMSEVKTEDMLKEGEYLLVFGDNNLLVNMDKEIEISLDKLIERIIDETFEDKVDVKQLTEKVEKELEDEIGVNPRKLINTVLNLKPKGIKQKKFSKNKLIVLIDDIMAGTSPVEKPEPPPEPEVEEVENVEEPEHVVDSVDDPAEDSEPVIVAPDAEDEPKTEDVDEVIKDIEDIVEDVEEEVVTEDVDVTEYDYYVTGDDIDNQTATEDQNQDQNQDQMTEDNNYQDQSQDQDQDNQQHTQQPQVQPEPEPQPEPQVQQPETKPEPELQTETQIQENQQTVVKPKNTPVFNEGDTTTRSVPENTGSGVDIGSPVSATDADGDTLTYTLRSDYLDGASFNIDSNTGQLRTKVSLDYETKSQYSVMISVDDGRGYHANIVVTIIVTDIDETPNDPPKEIIVEEEETPKTVTVEEDPPFVPNDPDETPNTNASTQGEPQQQQNLNNPPVFTEGDSTTRSIPENTFSDVDIGAAITATDADGDSLTYSLGGTNSPLFKIVSSSGQLKTKATFNFEDNIHPYSVTVSVSDGNGGTDSIQVTINVTDVDEPQGDPPPGGLTIIGDPTNDPPPPAATQQGSAQQATNNPPVFTDGETTTREVPENRAGGFAIGSPVSATDVDDDTLTYSLTGTDASKFSINTNSGLLLTKDNVNLDYELRNTYTVIISVSDGNGGSDSITVTIKITDEWEVTPPAPVAITITVPSSTTLEGTYVSGSSPNYTINIPDQNYFGGTNIFLASIKDSAQVSYTTIYKYTVSNTDDFEIRQSTAVGSIEAYKEAHEENNGDVSSIKATHRYRLEHPENKNVPELSNIASLHLKNGQLSEETYSLTITKANIGGTFPLPPPPPELPTSGFSQGDTGSFSASVSGQRLNDSGNPINGTSLPDIGGLKDADKMNYKYDITFTLNLDNINIDGWIWQGDSTTETYEDAEFIYIDASFSDSFVIRPGGESSEDIVNNIIVKPDSDDDGKFVIPGQYTIFTYLATHHFKKPWETKEITLPKGKFKKDIGRGAKSESDKTVVDHKAVMDVEGVVLTITGGTGNPDTFSYTVKTITGPVTITREIP